MGCFILGNIEYFNQAGGAKHWMKTFALLGRLRAAVLNVVVLSGTKVTLRL